MDRLRPRELIELTLIHVWKTRHILQGLLTHIPVLNSYRSRRARTGGSNAPRYCYSVWLRHLAHLSRYGFQVKGVDIGELGPGDSIGIGLSALLSGANRYIGLDVAPFALKSDTEEIFDELVRLYKRREPIPNQREYPRIYPQLDSYEFPDHLVDWSDFDDRAKKIRGELKARPASGQLVCYKAPWASPTVIATAYLDLIFSQAVLEHVDNLAETYRAMSEWLKPGGFSSHVIDFSAHHVSPYWNGHWTYSEWQWQLVRGRRDFLLNREPLSSHLTFANNFNLEVKLLTRVSDPRGLNQNTFAPRFKALDPVDANTRGAMLILYKPDTYRHGNVQRLDSRNSSQRVHH